MKAACILRPFFLIVIYLVTLKPLFALVSSIIPTIARRMSSYQLFRIPASSTRRSAWNSQSIHNVFILQMSTNNKGGGRPVPRKKNNKNKENVFFRADRVLSNRGWGSRSECFELLKKKRVFQEIDSKMICILGPKQKISMNASIFIDGKKEVPKLPPLLRVYHKPKWVLSVMNDSKGRKNLGDLDEKSISMMHPVGRLDYDSSGLLLFSSNGKLTQKLLHPSNEVEKEYTALVVGNVDEENLKCKLSQGVKTSIGIFPATLVDTTVIPENEVKPIIDDIISNLPQEYDIVKLEKNGHLFFKNASELTEVNLVVKEGKHRMVRRILANSGYPVIGLKRYRLGSIKLQDDLLPGCSRELTQEEDVWVRELLES